MKRFSFIIATLVLVLGFTQCEKNHDMDPTTEGVKISLSVDEGSKADVNPGTGTVTFQDGDVIYVGNGGKYVGKLTRTSGVFTGNITDPVEGEPLYFYFLGNITPGGTGNYLSVGIADQTSSLPVISCGTSTKNYSSAITSYSSKLMNKCALVKFNVTTSSTAATCITGFKNEVNVYFSSNTIAFIKDGKGSIKLPAGNGEKWAVLLPQNSLEAGEAGSAYSDDGSYKGTRGAVPIISENGYYTEGIQVQVTNYAHEYVDLGLPSGTLWATCNVGADTPEGWGNKYYIPESDQASTYWGTDWCTPTYNEWVELYQNTTSIWTTQNGEYGRLFTATNGNRLFLPAAGYRDSEYDLCDCGGFYWSRTIVTSDSRWHFEFGSDNYFMKNSYSDCAMPIRPVRSDSNPQTYMISVSANPSGAGTVNGGGACENGISCTVHAWANSGYVFANWTENGQVVSTDAAYTFVVSADRTLVANYTAYVDLGLPSGILWATYNVGAHAPEDYGDYFAWGETQTKDIYGWSTYKYCNGSNNALTKYCNNSSYGYNGFTDNLTTLTPGDDAATVNWGSGWRMPTQEEWRELYNNTTKTWTIQNGVLGFLFTGGNGNHLFLPAAGESDFGAGTTGCYWSSSLETDAADCAWYFYFYNPYSNWANSGSRDFGYSVRAVRSTH